MSEPEDSQMPHAIAIVGMAGRFPRAGSVEEFWRNVREGRECVTEFSEAELAASGVPAALIANPAYVRSGFTMAGTDLFDANFFGYTPREAESMDPQHRLFLEGAWEALEDAGYDPARYEGLIGAYAGCGLNNYVLQNLVFNRRFMESVGHFQIMMGNDKDFLTTRVSYKLNLKGPSLDIQTACSTSLVTVQMACQGLLSYQCDMALAGGVSIQAPRMKGYLYTEGQILSPDGHCRAFDSKANGTAIGEGLGVVVLKRLEDALADRDSIYAVIRGAAINNDGAVKVGYTAPSVDGQAAVIAMALAMAEVDPDTIGYVEAHGTGTPLGDPIEIAALTQVFRAQTDRKGFCAIGSVKTNIGHLDVAAGIAGLMKAALVLRHREIPPTLHFQSPNPDLDLENSPFHVSAALAPWPDGETPRRAAVSAFGIGGTNAHAVLEESPSLPASGPSRPVQLLLLSARTDKALAQATANLASHLRAHPELPLPDAAYTLQAGRRRFSHRRAALCHSRDDAIESLESLAPAKVFTLRDDSDERPAVFMFSGQGSQYVNMGREIHDTEPVFRDEIAACAECLKPHLGYDLRELLYPADDINAAAERINQTAAAQPALFAVEYALARLWMSWGIEPQAMIGHSIGEYVAACLAGVFRLEDCLGLVAARGKLMQAQPPGAMMAIMLPEEQVLALLTQHPALGAQHPQGSVSIATINAPSACVVSGPTAEMDALERQLEAREIPCRRLRTSHAFHSAMMDPVLKPFTELAAKCGPRPPRIPFVSNVTGTWITDAEAADPAYWGRHLRQPVRFAAGLGALLEEPHRAFLEIGPGNTLCSFVRQQPGAHVSLSTLRHPKEPLSDLSFLMAALGRFWLAGGRVDWAAFHQDEKRYRVSLPTYPFQRERFWITPTSAAPVPSDGGDGYDGSDRSDGSDGSNRSGGADRSVASRHPRPPVSTDYAAPRVPLEEALCRIWEEVLGIGPVGVHDNFFELGGHSLMATQIISRIRENIQANFPLRGIFEEPTIAGLAKIMASAETLAAPSAPPLVPMPRDADIPLSHAQKGMWFLYQLDPESPTSNVPVAFRLSGSLDTGVLERALREIQVRHEPLRATFHLTEEGPVQRIAEECQASLRIVDVSDLSDGSDGSAGSEGSDGAGLPAAARRFAHEEALRPFDLSTGPVMPATLLRLGPQDHLFLLSMHHIISDAWSLAVFIVELGALYDAYLAGEKSPLPALPIQYPDYVQWQSQWLRGDILESQLEFWKSHLQGELPVLNLPADRPRPPVPTYRCQSRTFRLPEQLSASLNALSQKQGATLFMTLLAAFKALLYRYTGEEDIVVGTPIANRVRPDLEKLIGLFINTLAMRTRLSGDLTFQDLLASVRETTLASYGRQDLPFGLLVEALRPERDLSHNPIYQVMLVLQNAPMPPLQMRGISCELLQTTGQSSELDLVLSVWEKDGALEGVANYSTDLFDPETVDRLLGHFQNLLQSIVSHPQARVSELELLSPAERERLLVRWNATEADFPRESRIQDLIETQAERAPQAPAVAFAGQTLTYSQLNQRANQLAHHLRTLGVGPETLVGLCVERSFEMIVGILGILKAGGAYVPMDPAYPPERLAFLLEDTRAPVLVVQERLAENLPPHGARIVRLDPEWRELSRENTANPAPLAHPENLAYVIYTSGSTGKPKGVQITHRNLVHSVTAHLARYHMPTKRFLLLFSYAFDGSVAGIFRTLTEGGMLVLPEEGGQMDVGHLAALIRKYRVTHTICLASLYAVLLSEIKPEDLESLELVVLGGEACTPELARRHHELLPNTRLSNEYGPTEAAVWCTEYTCRPGDRGSTVPIGTPIANAEAHVLDANRQVLPIGVAGELHIGGAGLARGYLNREDLTAERFVPHPFSAKPGARLYRTGDLVRRLPDGLLEFLGRMDHQVKVRGFRVELGEIEARLRAHPAIRDALVIARESSAAGAVSTAGKQLVAYVIEAGETEKQAGDLRLEAGGKETREPTDYRLQTTVSEQPTAYSLQSTASPQPTASPADLRAWVRQSLPEYMIPAFFVILDAFPTMPSGKVDLRALPAPDAAARAGTAPDSAAPTSHAEETLARIWCEALNLERVGIHDNYFELGGDSIIAIQIIHRANLAGLQLAPRLIFQHQTIAELAAAAGVSQPIHAEQGPVGGPAPLTPIQRWFFDQDLAGAHHWNQAMVLEMRSAVEPAVLEKALRHLVAQHDALRMRFRRNETGGLRLETGGTEKQAGDLRLETGGTEKQAGDLRLETGGPEAKDLASDPKPTGYRSQPPASSLQPPASSLQPPASSLQPTAYSLQSPASSLTWEQSNAPSDDEAGRLTRFDFSNLPEAEREQAFQRAAGELQGSLDISRGPLLRAALFNLGEGRPALLVLIVHHLVVDFVSWRILLEDLETACEQLAAGREIQLPRKTTSFQHWARRLGETAQSAQTQRELGFWLSRPWDKASSLPVDFSQGGNTAESARVATEYLTAAETHALLQEPPKTYHTQINEVLLMALARTLAKWTGSQTLLVELEGHGREDVIEDADLSRTVGWFTAVFPVLLDLEGASRPDQGIKAVKEQLRSVPNRGVFFGVLRYLAADAGVHDPLKSLPEPQMCFNYLGQFGQEAAAAAGRFAISWSPAGPVRHPAGRRLYLLEVDSMVSGGRLRMDWTYSANRHKPETIRNLARWFMDELRSFLGHCASPDAGGFTPSDFPEANLSQQELDDIMSELGKSEAPGADG